MIKVVCAIFVLIPMSIIFMLGGGMLLWFSVPQILKLVNTNPIPFNDLFAPTTVLVMGLLSIFRLGVGTFLQAIKGVKSSGGKR